MTSLDPVSPSNKILPPQPKPVCLKMTTGKLQSHQVEVLPRSNKTLSPQPKPGKLSIKTTSEKPSETKAQTSSHALSEQGLAEIDEQLHKLSDSTEDNSQTSQEIKTTLRTSEIKAQTTEISPANQPEVQHESETDVRLSTMLKVEFVVRQFFEKISGREDEKVKNYKQAFIKSRANYKDVSSNLAALYAPYKPALGNAIKLMSIPNPNGSMMVEPGDLKKPFSDKKGVATHAVGTQQLHKKVPTVQVNEVGEMKAYRFESDAQGKGLKKIERQVTPTSYFLGSTGADSEKATNHLMNTYVIQLDGKKAAIIRSGKIDTKERADDFATLLKGIHADLSQGDPNFKMRVVSQQLNTFDLGVERKIIENQHQLIAKVNKELKDIAEVVHINTPSNRYYHTTKRVRETLGAVGLGSVANFIEKYVLTGERLSKEQNLDSWGTYVKWTAEDIQKNMSTIDSTALSTPVKHFNREIKKTSAAIEDLKLQQEKISEDIRTAKELIAKWQGDLKENQLSPEQKIFRNEQIEIARERIKDKQNQFKTNRSKLRELLNTHKSQLEKFISQLDTISKKGDPKLKHDIDRLLQPASLMLQVLDSQLETKDNPAKTNVSRGREMLIIQSLNEKLRITSAMNCKSGLDRTGFLHAVKLGMLQMEAVQGGQPALRTMTQKWDEATLLINKKSVELSTDDFNKWVDEQKESDPALLAVIEFRKLVLDNLIRHGLPITKTSSGVEGLKWSPGTMGENLIPLNFLPTHVEIDGQVVPLVKYDKKTGEPTGVTLQGRQLLTKFSGLRGS